MHPVSVTGDVTVCMYKKLKYSVKWLFLSPKKNPTNKQKNPFVHIIRCFTAYSTFCQHCNLKNDRIAVLKFNNYSK